MSLNFYCKEEENSREESINRYKNIFKNYEKKTPSLSEALTQMFRSADLGKEKIKELTEDIINQCKDRIDPDFDIIKKKYENITKEDAYIICSYTCESIDREYSPYRILNQNLVSNNRQNGVNNVSKYLYIFLKSLRKLPRYYPEKKVLYRCLTCHVILSLFSFSISLSEIKFESNLLSLKIKFVSKILQVILIMPLTGGKTFEIINFLSGSNKISFSLK